MKNLMSLYFIVSILVLVNSTSAYGQSENKINQPELTPKVFAPGFISTGMYERDLAITMDGNEIYYSLFQGDWNTIMMTKKVNGIWQEPIVAPFARDTMFFFA